MSISGLILAIHEQLHEMEDRYRVRHSKGVFIFFTPTDGGGEGNNRSSERQNEDFAFTHRSQPLGRIKTKARRRARAVANLIDRSSIVQYNSRIMV